MKTIKITIVTQCDDDTPLHRIQSAIDGVIRSVDDDEILKDLWACNIDGDVDVKVEEV